MESVVSGVRRSQEWARKGNRVRWMAAVVGRAGAAERALELNRTVGTVSTRTQSLAGQAKAKQTSRQG